MSDGTEREPFEAVAAKAYGWLVDDEGYLCGLVTGDMGYDTTDMKLVDLIEAAQCAEWRRYHETGEKNWPVHSATIDFIEACREAVYGPRNSVNPDKNGAAQ